MEGHDLYLEALRLRRDGMSYRQIAEKLAAHYRGRLDKPAHGWAVSLVRRALEQVNQPGADGDKPLTVSAERVMVFGDVHAPAVDFELADWMLQVAKRERITTAILAGDMLNMDAFSVWPRIRTPDTFSTELDVARALFRDWLGWFECVYWLPGNHERRLFKALGGELNMQMLARLLGLPGGVVVTTPFSYIWLRSGARKWQIIHSKNRSVIPGRVGAAIALRDGCDVITYHQHQLALVVAPDGQHVVVDGGGLFDPRRLDYVYLNASKDPRMVQGFVTVVDGKVRLYSPVAAIA